MSLKSPNTIRIYAENTNGLPNNPKLWRRSKKYTKLNYLFHCLQVDIVSLVETQINPVLLDATYNIPDRILASELHTYIINNNSIELISYQ